ncbi:MAG TPA: septum formation initiator family protein [Anaeromyxobacteraceae bacterium]|nr:septum formation initiator family protein [Anaeromyxobacteraceae bacterium]
MPVWRSWAFRLYLGGLVLLALVSALDPGGLRKARRLAGEAGRIEADNARLAEENARLSREVKALRTDPSAMERAAREDLGLVRPGERVYRVEGPGP